MKIRNEIFLWGLSALIAIGAFGTGIFIGGSIVGKHCRATAERSLTVSERYKVLSETERIISLIALEYLEECVGQLRPGIGERPPWEIRSEPNFEGEVD